MKETFRSLIGTSLKGMAPGLTGVLGGTLTEVLDDGLSMEFIVTDELCNPTGNVHGGTFAAIMDDVMGMAVASMGNENHYVSVNLSLDMLSSAKKGEKVVASATIIRRGRQLINVACDIKNADGKLLSRGSQNFITSQITKPL